MHLRGADRDGTLGLIRMARTSAAPPTRPIHRPDLDHATRDADARGLGVKDHDERRIDRCTHNHFSDSGLAPLNRAWNPSLGEGLTRVDTPIAAGRVLRQTAAGNAGCVVGNSLPAQAGLKALTTSAAQLGVRATTPKPATLKLPEIGKVTRLASSIDQVTITPVRIDAPKPAVSAYQGSAAGEVMTPAKSFKPKAQADYSGSARAEKGDDLHLPEGDPDRADAVAPKPQQVTGPTPPSAPNSQALQAMRTSVPPDATGPATPRPRSASLPLRVLGSLQVGRLSPGQGSALIGPGCALAAQAAVVGDDNATQTSSPQPQAAERRGSASSIRCGSPSACCSSTDPQHLQDLRRGRRRRSRPGGA